MLTVILFISETVFRARSDFVTRFYTSIMRNKSI